MKHILLTLSAFALMLSIAVGLSLNYKQAQASGNTVTGFNSFASSSSVLIGTASQTIIATNTARVYLRISNLSAGAVYCNLKGGLAASAFSGLTIFGSSTVEFKIDENPYLGPVSCLTAVGTASTTILER